LQFCGNAKKQAPVALSSIEAKIHWSCFNSKRSFMVNTTHEGPWITSIQTYSILFDNQSCIVLPKTTNDHDCTKHIDIKYHYLQEKIASLKIEFRYCPIEQMLVDVITKALPKPKHRFCVEVIGLTIPNPKV